jgi:hypothetical protein
VVEFTWPFSLSVHLFFCHFLPVLERYSVCSFLVCHRSCNIVTRLLHKYSLVILFIDAPVLAHYFADHWNMKSIGAGHAFKGWNSAAMQFESWYTAKAVIGEMTLTRVLKIVSPLIVSIPLKFLPHLN